MILSICIPTYNNVSHVLKIVQDILTSNLDIELVVSDNCSTDNTFEELTKIQDKRLKVYRNEENIGAIPNCTKVLSLSTGEYSLFLFDKDEVIVSNLPILIKFLQTNSVNAGFCTLAFMDSSKFKQKNPNRIYNQGFDGVKNVAYLSSHHSGHIYKTKELQNLSTFKNALEKKEIFDYFFELWGAELAYAGRVCIFNIPVVLLPFGPSGDYGITKTYSKDNYFFLPKARINEFTSYFKHACSSLRLTKEEFLKLFKSIYEDGLFFITSFYNFACTTEWFSYHYQFSHKPLTIFEYIYCDFLFSMSFINTKLNTSILEKLLIIFSTPRGYFSTFRDYFSTLFRNIMILILKKTGLYIPMKHLKHKLFPKAK